MDVCLVGIFEDAFMSLVNESLMGMLPFLNHSLYTEQFSFFPEWRGRTALAEREGESEQEGKSEGEAAFKTFHPFI